MSGYKVLIGLSHYDNSSKLGPTDDIFAENSSIVKIPDEFRTPGFQKKYLEAISRDIYKSILISVSNQASCREVVVGNALTALQGIYAAYNGGFTYCTLYVKIGYEFGSQVHSNHPLAAYAREFHEIFFSNNYDKNWGIVVRDDSVTIARRFNSAECATGVYTLSLFLWILRNENILESVLKEFRGRKLSSITPLMNYLAHNFLKHANWGDGANSNLNLSIFSYAVTKSIYSAGSNGPNNVVLRTELKVLMDYVQEVYLEAFPESKGLVYDKLSGVSSDNHFYRALDSLINLFTRAQSPKKSAQPEVERISVEFDKELD
jgi:hypothetical protein